MKRLIIVSLTLFCIGLTTLGAQQTASDVPRIQFEKYTLPNGLEVILSEDRRLPQVAVNVWYHVGPANEEPGRTGFAHLFEHLMFQGSKHVPEDSHFKLLEAAGSTQRNGTTSSDRTNYFETVPANQLELALWLEADRMGFMIDTLDQRNLSNQQDVVRNERRQTHENRPYGLVEDALNQALFPRNHPYHANIIGSHADIQAATLEDARQFARLYYRPNNATLAVVGDIDNAATRKLIEKYFGSLRRGPDVPRINAQTPPITSERRVVVEDRVQLTRVYMAWLTPAFFKDGDADADIASGVLGRGRTSRLFRKLVYEKQIAQDVQAYQASMMLTSIFGIEATVRPGHSAAEVEAAIDEELALLRKSAPEQAEVDRARTGMETLVVRSMERIGVVADRLNQYNHFVGTPDYISQDFLRYRKVTPESVRRFVQAYLRPEARVIVEGVPGQQNLGAEVPGNPSGATTVAVRPESINEDEPWRADIPKAGPVRLFKAPEPRSFELANGLKVLLVEQREMPFISASVVLRTGNDANPVDRPGLASFTAAMLDQGTSTRTSLQLAEEAAQIGASLSANTTANATLASTSSLTRNFPAALALLSDMVLRPSFPEAEIDRLRRARLTALIQRRSNAANAADTIVASVLFGPSHPQGHNEVGNASSLNGITRDGVQQFWNRNFVPGNAALIVSGSISMDELRRLAEANFGQWPSALAPPSPAAQPKVAATRLVLVDSVGANQTQIRIAGPGLPRSSADYFVVRVMNEILGGVFSSRINMNLREANGYTYGARSQFAFMKDAGTFTASSQVRADVTTPAVQEILKEIERIAATSVTPDELVAAKEGIIRSLPSGFETSEGVVGSTSTLFVYGLPLDYFSTVSDRFASVTAADVQAAAKRYLHPDTMLIVAVGDLSKIRQPLEAAFGRADVRDSEGNPLAPF